MRRNKKIDECCHNMATSTEYPSDRCIRPLILTQSFICTVDSSYKEFAELGADASSQEESFIKLMVGANLRHFESLKATLETELSKCPNSVCTSSLPISASKNKYIPRNILTTDFL